MNEELAKEQRAVSEFWFSRVYHGVNQVTGHWKAQERNFAQLLDLIGDSSYCLGECDEEEQEERHPQEACNLFELEFEKFAVDDFLGSELRERGEVVAEIYDFKNVWFRQTYGQLCSLDHVIVEIWKSSQALAA